MGTTLHNKIYLGRASLFASRRNQALLAGGLCVAALLALALLRAQR